MMSTLAERLKKYMDENKKDITVTANEIEKTTGGKMSRPTLSKYIRGVYEAQDMTNVENTIIAFLESVGADSTIEPNKDEVTTTEEEYVNTDIVNRGFLRSKDANMIMAVAKACQDDHLLGVIPGRSGLGKTFTLKTYASKFDKVIYIECDDSMNGRDLIAEIEEGIGLPENKTTKRKRIQALRRFFKMHPGYLLIIDEADKLISRDTISKLEILRNLHDGTADGAVTDESTLGIVIAGELKLETLIKTYDERLANRIDQRYKLTGLTREDVCNYVKGLDVTDRALEELISRATNQKNGCFRLLRRTMKNVNRILKPTGKSKITLDVIKEASEMMML